MIIAFAGVGILTADKAGQGSAGHWVGDLILLVSTLVFAIYTILVKEVANQFDALTLNTLIFVLGAIMMLPFCAHAVVVTNWAALSLEAWWGLAFMVVFGSVISYLLFAYVMTELAGIARRRLQLFAAGHRQRIGHLGAFGTADFEGADRRRLHPGGCLSDRARAGRRESCGDLRPRRSLRRQASSDVPRL